MQKKINSNDLRSAFDKFMYERDQYQRRLCHLTFSQVDIAESTVTAVHAMIDLAAKKLKEIDANSL